MTFYSDQKHKIPLIQYYEQTTNPAQMLPVFPLLSFLWSGFRETTLHWAIRSPLPPQSAKASQSFGKFSDYGGKALLRIYRLCHTWACLAFPGWDWGTAHLAGLQQGGAMPFSVQHMRTNHSRQALFPVNFNLSGRRYLQASQLESYWFFYRK